MARRRGASRGQSRGGSRRNSPTHQLCRRGTSKCPEIDGGGVPLTTPQTPMLCPPLTVVVSSCTASTAAPGLWLHFVLFCLPPFETFSPAYQLAHLEPSLTLCLRATKVMGENISAKSQHLVEFCEKVPTVEFLIDLFLPIWVS